MKKTLITVAVVAVVIFLLALPKLNLFKGTDPANPVPGQAQGGGRGGKLSVDAIIIKFAPLDSKLNVTGSVLPNESLELKSEVSGKITAIYFREGKQVRKGDTLIQTNDDEIEALLQKQKYNRKLNEDNEFRQRKLLEKEAISQEEYDNALNRLNTTDADIRLLETQLAKTKIMAPICNTWPIQHTSVARKENPFYY
jgi:membrane fusion protein (multidrug efflux system)